jgi:ABC-type transporter Mla subunit MlaD
MDKALKLMKVLVLAALFFALAALGVLLVQAHGTIKHVDELAVAGVQLVQTARDRTAQLDSTLQKADAVLESANTAIKSADTSLRTADTVLQSANTVVKNLDDRTKVVSDNINRLLVGEGMDERSVQGVLANANGVLVQLGLAADLWREASQEQKDYWSKNSEEFRKVLEEAQTTLRATRETVEGVKPIVSNLNDSTGEVKGMLKEVHVRLTQTLKPGNFVWGLIKSLLGLGGSAAQIVK